MGELKLNKAKDNSSKKKGILGRSLLNVVYHNCVQPTGAWDAIGYDPQSGGEIQSFVYGSARCEERDDDVTLVVPVRPVGGDTGHDLIQQIETSISESRSQLAFDDDRLVVQRTLEFLKSEFEPQTWQAFWRTTVGNERAADIAEELGMTKKAVRQAKYRILKRLRQELELQLDVAAA